MHGSGETTGLAKEGCARETKHRAVHAHLRALRTQRLEIMMNKSLISIILLYCFFSRHARNCRVDNATNFDNFLHYLFDNFSRNIAKGKD